MRVARVMAERFQTKDILLKATGIVLYFLISAAGLIAQNASIEGTVILEASQDVSSTSAVGSYQSFRSHSAEEQVDSTSNGFLVWLEDKNQEAEHESTETSIQVLDQVNKRFYPRLMAVKVGDFVRIKNSDPVYHNVFSLSKVKRFDVGRRSPKDYEDVYFDKTGIVDVFCDIHSDMHAVIRVLPKYTLQWKKIEGSGTFRFENVPEGEYVLRFYTMGDRSESMDVEVAGANKLTVGTIRL